MIFVIDDDEIMAGCVSDALKKVGLKTRWFDNAIEAMNEISADVPEMIFLDPMLTGPDGFTFLNEMASYADTAKVPIVIMSEKDFSGFDMSEYGVIGFLDKNKMKPEEILGYAKRFAE